MKKKLFARTDKQINEMNKNLCEHISVNDYDDDERDNFVRMPMMFTNLVCYFLLSNNFVYTCTLSVGHCH
jgi:hypothetical protein